MGTTDNFDTSAGTRASLVYVPREAAEAPVQDDLAMAEAP